MLVAQAGFIFADASSLNISWVPPHPPAPLERRDPYLAVKSWLLQQRGGGQHGPRRCSGLHSHVHSGPALPLRTCMPLAWAPSQAANGVYSCDESLQSQSTPFLADCLWPRTCLLSCHWQALLIPAANPSIHVFASPWPCSWVPVGMPSSRSACWQQGCPQLQSHVHSTRARSC